MRDSETFMGWLWGTVVAWIILFLVGGIFWIWPQYRVYSQRMEGEAELARATQNRQISEYDATAAIAKAKGDAQAEIERAKGAAEANQILADSLQGKEDYLRYLYIDMMRTSNTGGREIIYIPTEGGLPILEAGRATAPPPQP